MKKSMILLVAGIVTLGCIIPSVFPSAQATPTVDCLNIGITDADVDTTLQYGMSLLGSGDWERSYTVNTDQVYVGYISAELNAVVFLDTYALCNATSEVRNYTSEENFALIFANYDEYTLEDSCEKDGDLLSQFTAINEGTEYRANLWFTPLEDPSRALEVMLVFPQADPESLAEYSAVFFPAFTSCK